MASSTTEATESGIPMKITGRFVCWPKWDMEVAGVLNCRYLPDRYHLVESTVKMSWSEPNEAAWRVDGTSYTCVFCAGRDTSRQDQYQE